MATLRNRIGLIGEKLGMSAIFADDGRVLPVTLIKIYDTYIYSCKTSEKDGYSAVTLAFDEKQDKKARKCKKMLTNDGKVRYFKHFKEFRLKEDGQFELGKQISIKHFVEGQLIDAIGTSIGKGFAGVMKRYNFSGLEASHGVSVSHRAHGSTGQRQDPGKVFKGKKMAGHMGDRRVTVQNLQIARIDEELGVIAVLGAVPGAEGSCVTLCDAVKSYIPLAAPFPTAYVGENAASSDANSENSEEISENVVASSEGDQV